MAKKKNKTPGININAGVCTKELGKVFKSVTVTAKNIRDGVKGDAESCAIALAIKDALGADGEGADIQVSAGTAEFTIEKDIDIPVVICGEPQDNICKRITVRGELNLGDKADTFIEAFDGDKKSVKPTTFKAKPEITIEVNEVY